MVSESVRSTTLDLPDAARFPFRLRHLLALLVFAALGNWIWPRGHAAWKVHNLAVAYADYALCMVGPTGPELMRENPAVFIELTRRRVVSAMPEEQPFRACQALSEQIGVEHEVYRLHMAPAADFDEYKHTPGVVGPVSVSEFDLSLARLEDLAGAAWPFVRSGTSKLMKPSSHAKEAPHAPSAPVAGRGSGLPATRSLYRSTAAFGDAAVVALGSGANAMVLSSKNEGVDWAPGGRRLASELRDRCVADEEGRAFTLSRMNDGRRIVLSQGPGAAPQVASLSPGEEEIAGISCDESALVAALVKPADATGNRPIRLRLCPFRRPCRDLTPPAMGMTKLYYPADVARIDGDTILSRTSGGMTRVASSRDDGRSWTPWTVAFDRVVSGPFDAAPFRFLVVGDQVHLYAGGRSGAPYALLISTDHGASFRAPVLSSEESRKERPSQALLNQASLN